jgi:hypothetical protein
MIQKMTKENFATGSCQCGEIRLEIKRKPKMMLQCHCLDCQKSSGTGHTSSVYFAKNEVLIKGEARGHTVLSDSGAEMTRYFCPSCGNRLYGSNSAQPDLLSVAVGCLQDHSWFKPQAVIYISKNSDWDITSDGVPHFDSMPPK